MATICVGSLLMVGVVAIFSQGRSTYGASYPAQRLQESMLLALSTLRPDIRLARSLGIHSAAAPVTVSGAVTVHCADGSAASARTVEAGLGVEAFNGSNELPCPPVGGWRPGSDVLVLRHASREPATPMRGVIQIQSNRTLAVVFDDGSPPLAGACPPACIYDWHVQAWYVSPGSSAGAHVPALRRQFIVDGVIRDEEIIAGVEDLQVQFGVDRDGDNGIERFVNADDPLLDPGSADYAPGTRVLAMRLWLMFRSEQAETGFADRNSYSYADVTGFRPDDGYRRVLLNRTTLLRSSRG